MQTRSFYLIWACLMLSACAAKQELEESSPLPEAGVVMTSGAAAEVAGQGFSVCETKQHGDQDRLDQHCLNRVEGLPNGGKRYNAVGRPKKELPSLCKQMYLPRCRRTF